MKKLLIPVCFILFVIIVVLAANSRNQEKLPQESVYARSITKHYKIDINQGNIKNVIINGIFFDVKIFPTNKNYIYIDVNKTAEGCYEKDFLESFMDSSKLNVQIEGETLNIELEQESIKYKLEFIYDLIIYVPHRVLNFSINSETLYLSVYSDFDGSFSLKFNDGSILFKNFYGILKVDAENARINIDNGVLTSGSEIHVNKKGNIYIDAALAEGGKDYIIETEDGNIIINSDSIKYFNVITDSLLIDDKYNLMNYFAWEDDNGKTKLHLKALNGIIKLV